MISLDVKSHKESYKDEIEYLHRHFAIGKYLPEDNAKTPNIAGCGTFAMVDTLRGMPVEIWVEH